MQKSKQFRKQTRYDYLIFVIDMILKGDHNDSFSNSYIPDTANVTTNNLWIWSWVFSTQPIHHTVGSFTRKYTRLDLKQQMLE